MATEEQRARRRAQRATAERLRGKGKYTPVVPRSTRAAVRAGRETYAKNVIAGREPYPEKGTREANNLASLASKARWGKADPAYEAAFSRYWYHRNDEKNETDLEDNADYQADNESGGNNENSEKLYSCRPSKSLSRATHRFLSSEKR